MEASNQELWVFAYGSLMWRPGFDYDDAVPAHLEGAHRSLCIYSVVHRGVPGRPGLVLGLDLGGFCQGLAFRAAKAKAADVLSYLRKRELVTHVYQERRRKVKLLDSSGRQVSALCYLADRSHPQYAGALPVDLQASIVRRSRGRSGHNIEYVLNTIACLRDFRISDSRLERLLTRLGRHRLI